VITDSNFLCIYASFETPVIPGLNWMNKGVKGIFVKSASVSLPSPLGSPMIDSFKQWRELT
jgi:hypothetical protein